MPDSRIETPHITVTKGILTVLVVVTTAADTTQLAHGGAPHVELVQQRSSPAAASEEAFQVQSLYSTQLSAQQQPRTQQSAQQLPAGHVGLGTLVLSDMHAAELNTASNRAVSVEEPQQSAAAGDAEQPPAHQHASGSMDLKADDF